MDMLDAIRQALPGLETPCVLVDKARLAANIVTMADLAKANGLALRPHVKTHKCLEIAALLMAHGAVGLTASKPGEARVFVEAGFDSITVAYPVVESRAGLGIESNELDRLLEAAKARHTDLRFIADCPAGVATLSKAAQRHGLKLGVFIKIDVGLRRCGLQENDPDLVDLAREIARAQALDLVGILSHAGQAYGAQDKAGATAVAEEERRIMARVKAGLEQAGHPIREVSVGSTPTVLATESFKGITEIRPGNYVFLDRTPLRLGLARPEQVALYVLATVVSANDRYLIMDAGSKVLASDIGAHGSGGPDFGYGLARLLTAEGKDVPDESGPGLTVKKLSEEHGFVARPESGPGTLAEPGDVLLVTPNHACPVVNLADTLHALGPENETWAVAARGRVV